jgi:hypothetical protein
MKLSDEKFIELKNKKVSDLKDTDVKQLTDEIERLKKLAIILTYEIDKQAEVAAREGYKRRVADSSGVNSNEYLNCVPPEWKNNRLRWDIQKLINTFEI